MATWTHQTKNTSSPSYQTKSTIPSWYVPHKSDYDFLLKEDGGFLLQEDGVSRFLLEQTGSAPIWTYLTKN